MTTYPLPSLCCSVGLDGISAPSFADIFASLQASYQGIFGSDVILTPDSQDGQWLAVIASAINDSNAQTISTYNAFSPATAVGNGLSSVVKINGIQREIATNSTADVVIVGTAGTVISNGLISGPNNHTWALPPEVTIPLAGEITVTATCVETGDFAAPANSLTQIKTPTRGWQSATNPVAATTGAAVEGDAALRLRQTISTALPAQSIFDATVGTVANLVGVQRLQAYENDTSATDGNGIPPHSIALVVEGGDAAEIAAAILFKKGPGCGTYGSTSVDVTDPNGFLKTVEFSRPVVYTIGVKVWLTPLTGFASTTEALIKTAVAAYLDALVIGQDVLITKLYGPVNLDGDALGETYDVTDVQIKVGAGAYGHANITIPFDGAAFCDSAVNVEIVTP